MGWTDPSTSETVTEDSAGAGKFMAAVVALQPRETVHLRFVRQDSPTEPWVAEVYAVLDDTVPTNPPTKQPIASRRIDAADDETDIVVTGPRNVIARVVNGDPTPSDVVSVDIDYTLDGVNF